MTLRLRIYFFLASIGPLACLAARPVANPLSQNDVLAKGLQIWRKPGAIQNHAACATCHSPDGIELAAYNFGDDNLMRRALPHVGSYDATLLVAYIHALRDKLKLSPLRDPNNDRPLQPGGSVLPGATPGERDLAFGMELRDKLPILFGERIETVEQAKAAEAELLKIQPMTLRIGIPFNRLSEDIAHGNEHSSIAQWLPEIPTSIADGEKASWYSAEDAYLQNPTPENLHGLIVKHEKLVSTDRMQGLDTLSAMKFRAMLVLQDRMRNRVEHQTSSLTSDVGQYGNYNPLWKVGEVARDMMGMDPTAFGMDAEVRARKTAGPSFKDQLSQIRLAWFWAGWLSDQGMFQTSHDDKVRLGMWLSQSLSEDGPYPIHNVFANARRQAVVSNEPASWAEPAVRKRRVWDLAGLRSFAYESRDLPTEPTYRALTLAFTTNCFRMNLLLLKDDIQRTHAVWIKELSRFSAKRMTEFLKMYDPGGATTAQTLFNEIGKLIDGAKERNQFSPALPPAG